MCNEPIKISHLSFPPICPFFTIDQRIQPFSGLYVSSLLSGFIGSGSMEVDTKNRDPKTLRDEDGHYPVWMNSRRIKRHKKRLQSMAKKKEKTQKAKKKR